MGGIESDKRLQFEGAFGLERPQALATEMYRGYKSGNLAGKHYRECYKRE
ncbi:MAG: hypothetical protein JWQ40_21 [Segetibacter sp.]|nr:hypothetical protein [Segetibacter sp.]